MSHLREIDHGCAKTAIKTIACNHCARIVFARHCASDSLYITACDHGWRHTHIRRVTYTLNGAWRNKGFKKQNWEVYMYMHTSYIDIHAKSTQSQTRIAEAGRCVGVEIGMDVYPVQLLRLVPYGGVTWSTSYDDLLWDPGRSAIDTEEKRAQCFVDRKKKTASVTAGHR